MIYSIEHSVDGIKQNAAQSAEAQREQVGMAQVNYVEVEVESVPIGDLVDALVEGA
ncbi:MAG UNVERIFIED_CONTAM: hypothetical protein LVQ98_00375 [Rickettsiaceae bacterium]|jgi:hypothetical protein